MISASWQTARKTDEGQQQRESGQQEGDKHGGDEWIYLCVVCCLQCTRRWARQNKLTWRKGWIWERVVVGGRIVDEEGEREESSDGDEGGWEGQGNHQGKARPVKASGGQPASPLQRSPPQLSTSTNKPVPSKFLRPQQQQRVGRTATKCANRLDDDEPDAVRASSSSVGVKTCIRDTGMSLTPREDMCLIYRFLAADSYLPPVG